MTSTVRDHHNRLLNILKISDPEIFLADKFNHKQPISSEIITILFGFNYELSRIIPTSSNQEIIQLKYKWWQDAVSRMIKQGHVDHNHYILVLLKDVITKYDLSYQDFDIIFNARSFDLTDDKFQSNLELEDYIENYLGQIFIIYQRVNNITLSKSEQETIKEICCISKILKILWGLKKYNYNEHPFITAEMIVELQKFPALKRQIESYKLLKGYLAAKYDLVVSSDRIPDALLENIRVFTMMQAKLYLKSNQLANLRPYNHKELSYRFYINKIFTAR